MRKLFLGILMMGILVINVNGGEATTTVSGTVSGTWLVANSPYIVTGTVTVDSGTALTIEPGVVVKFATNTTLISYGVLSAIGQESNKIVFTAYRDETNGQGTSTVAQPRDWRGIKIVGNGANNSEIKYSIIKYGKQGIWLEGVNNVSSVNNLIKDMKSDESPSNVKGEMSVGIYLISSSNNIIEKNTILNITGGNGVIQDFGGGVGGLGCNGIGIYGGTASTNNVISENIITNITGGKGGGGDYFYNGPRGGIGAGIYLAFSNYGTINHNSILNIYGGEGGGSAYAVPAKGEPGVGIYVESSVNVMIFNNSILNIEGGKGGDGGAFYYNSGDGSDGKGIYLSSSNAVIKNNTIFGNKGGIGGTGGVGNGVEGKGIGIHCTSSYSDKFIYNNIYDNQTYNLQTDISPGQQIAEYNWWGADPPDTAKFFPGALLSFYGR